MSFNKKFFTTGGIVASSPAEAAFDPLANFETVTYTGNGSTKKVNGYIRKGAAFNGSSSSFIEIPATATTPIDFSSEDFTISMWINPASLSTTMTFFGKYSSSSDSPTTKRSILMRITTSGEIVVIEHNGTTGYTQTSTGTISANTWSFIAYTRNGTTSNIYIDDNSAESQARSNTIKDGSTQSIALGGSRPSSGSFNGKLDQVRFFNTELNSTQVGQLADEDYDSSTKSTTDIFGDGIALYEFEDNARSSNFGQAASFNGSSSKIDIDATSTTPVDFSTKTFTISAWINGSNFTSDDRTIISKYSGSNDTTSSFFFDVRDNDQKLRVTEINGTSALGLQSAGSISVNTWTHVAYVRTPTTCEFFINGVSSGGSQSRTTNINAGGTTDISIGERQANKRFIGSIDQVRIYSSALDSNDVAELYAESADVPTTNLVAHYKLDGNANDETETYDGTETSITYAGGVYSGTPTNIDFLGMAFQPDFVWLKCRDAAKDHRLYDSVRGATYFLEANNPDDEDVASTSLTSFDSNGFTLGAASTTNSNGDDFVAWCWKAAGAADTYNVLENGTVTSDSTASGAGITAGTITTGWEVSANRDAGFSIVKWTADGNGVSSSIGHGLSSTPEIIFTKDTDSSNDWIVNSSLFSNPARDFLKLNLSNAKAFNSADTYDLSTSTFKVGARNGTSGKVIISYCFHSVDGYQRVGTYSGTGASGNRIYTTDDGTSSGAGGFRPRFVMVKRTDSTGNWVIKDSQRDSTNPNSANLYPNLNNAENTVTTLDMDFNDDGFTLDGTSGDVNASGTDNYIYLAIA